MNWQQITQQRISLGRPFVMAHRGASDILPENSPSAFYRAIADGADVLETDLHFTKDEEIVVIHDNTVDRTLNGCGLVSEMTLTELKRLKIRQPRERQAIDERILTLAEYIAFTGGKIATALELKDPRFAQPRFAEKLVAILSHYQVLEIYGVISFDLPHVQAVQAIQPTIATGWITMSHLWPNKPVNFIGPLWPILLLNPFYVAWAHRLGKIVCPLDPSPEKRIPLYLRLGVDMLITNNPALTLQTLGQTSSLSYALRNTL